MAKGNQKFRSVVRNKEYRRILSKKLPKTLVGSKIIDVFSLACKCDYTNISEIGKGWNNEDIGFYGLKPGGEKDKERIEIENDKEKKIYLENNSNINVVDKKEEWIIEKFVKKEKIV